MIGVLIGIWLSIAHAAPVVHVEGDFGSAAGSAQMSERVDEMWRFISQLLHVPAGTPPPMLYAYPIRPEAQPALLTGLQRKMKNDFGSTVSEETFFAALARLKGITYRADLFSSEAPEKGRVIQVNSANTFVKETGGSYGYGLYVSSHEMVHYALNVLGVAPKYQHCVMVDESADGGSIMFRVLRHQIEKNWASEVLSFKAMGSQGYVEEAMSCGGDMAQVQQEEGATAVDAMLTEAARLSAELLEGKAKYVLGVDGMAAMTMMPNCSGALVRLKGASDNSKALILTNGHCAIGFTTGLPAPGQAYSKKAFFAPIALLNRSGEIRATYNADQILYATMTGTDVALLQLPKTYSEIRSETALEALSLASSGPAVGRTVSVPSGALKEMQTCSIEAQVKTVREGAWAFSDSLRYSSECQIRPRSSGSPVMSGDGKVIAINNTVNTANGEACSLNNPCEVGSDGKVSGIVGRGYAQQVALLNDCVSESGEIDLLQPGCELQKGGL